MSYLMTKCFVLAAIDVIFVFFPYDRVMCMILCHILYLDIRFFFYSTNTAAEQSFLIITLGDTVQAI